MRGVSSWGVQNEPWKTQKMGSKLHEKGKIERFDRIFGVGDHSDAAFHVTKFK